MPWFDEARIARVEHKLDAIKSILLQVARLSRRSELSEMYIMANIQDLVAEVANTKSVQESAMKAIAGLVAQLEAARADDNPEALDAAIADLKNSSAALAAAIPANTPAEEPVVVADPAEPTA
jgi:hypothetical protein